MSVAPPQRLRTQAAAVAVTQNLPRSTHQRLKNRTTRMDKKESQTKDETDETDEIDEEESGKEQDNGNEEDDGIESDNDDSNNEGNNDDGSNNGSLIIDDDDGHQGAQNTSGYMFPFTFALFEGHLLSFRPRRPLLLLSGRFLFYFSTPT